MENKEWYGVIYSDEFINKDFSEFLEVNKNKEFRNPKTGNFINISKKSETIEIGRMKNRIRERYHLSVKKIMFQMFTRKEEKSGVWFPAIYNNNENFGHWIEINKNGEIRNSFNGYIKSPCINNSGYFITVLVINKVRLDLLMHRLIACTFIPNPNNLPCVNHINGIKSDNRLENLEWCTYSENTQHAWNIGLCKVSENQKEACKVNRKLNFKQTRDIIEEYENGNTSHRKLAKKYNVGRTCIANIVNRTTYTEE